MRTSSIIIPIICACVNIPYFPNTFNIIAFIFCLSIGLINLIQLIKD